MRLVEHQTLIYVRKVLERLKAFLVDVWRRHVNADLYIQIAAYSNVLVVYATVDNSRALRKRNAGNVISSSAIRISNVVFWSVDTHLATVERFAFISSRLCRGRYSLRSADI